MKLEGVMLSCIGEELNRQMGLDMIILQMYMYEILKINFKNTNSFATGLLASRASL